MKTTTNEVNECAIILKTTPYKENDCILHVYTKTYGKLGIIAKGVRKMTSKNAFATQSLMISDLTFYLKKGLSLLVKANAVNYYKHIKENIESEIVANYVLEYFYRYTEDNQPQIEYFDTILAAMNALENGYPPLLVYLLFNVFILKINGVTIDVNGCVICGNHQVVSISVADGGFVCLEHMHQSRFFDKEVLRGFRYIHMVSLQNIDKLHLEMNVILELVEIMDNFVEEYTGVLLKTKKFIKQIV